MKITLLVFSSLVLLSIHIASSQINPVSDADVLAYSVFNYSDGTTLYIYDANSDESTVLYQVDDRLHFVFGSNGYIAFSTEWVWENNGKLFILDTTKPNQPPVNLSQDIGILGYPLGWSDDGNYLAFASEIDEDQGKSIYVWDGTRAINISPQNTLSNPQSFDIAWSPDGRLAFTVWFGSSNLDPRSEIYLWDGDSTLNLSQNADAEDREPSWNTDGELVFGSILDNETILLLWDGISYDDGLPDVTSFTRVASPLHIFSPFSVWFGNDVLAFEAIESQDARVQIYEWHGQTWANISQISNTNSYTPQWSQTGDWAFVDGQEHLYVRDISNKTIFEADGQSPAWSSSGSLVFCRRNGRSDWKLTRWNRASVSTIIQGDIIYAQWRSGQTTVCSNG